MRARTVALTLLGAVIVGCPDAREEATTTTTSAPETSTGDASSEVGTTAEPVESTTSDVADETGTSTDTGDPPDPPASGPEVYPPGVVHSPITPHVAEQLSAIAATRAERFEDVFMKVGASSTVNMNTLFCFAGPDVELGRHRELAPTLAFFLGGDAAGTTPFDRVSLAAQVGETASWAIAGDPSPLQAELDALSPRLAFVHYGTNDMGAGATFDAALQAFYGDMNDLFDGLQQQGVVPIAFGITRRGDSEDAQKWVATFNAAIRGMAQARQIPFVDLFAAIDGLPGNGLGADGLHLEAYADGACILDAAGLEHGYNVRNLVALEVLDRVSGVLVDDRAPPDDPAPPRVGTGTQGDPIVVDGLPFADARDTARSGARGVDTYGCGPRDESGPEMWYRLELAEATRLRIVVLDRERVDVDVNLLDGSADPIAGCVARDDRILELTASAGVHHIVVDTWAGADGPLPGEYLLLVVACEPDDAACDG